MLETHSRRVAALPPPPPPSPAQLHHSCVLAAVEVQLAQEAVLDVVQHVPVHGVRRALALQLEDDHAAVVT